MCGAAPNWDAGTSRGMPRQCLPGAPPYNRLLSSNPIGGGIMFSLGNSGFTNFVADAFAVFMFLLWFWLFITAASDLFRRRDISGFGKVLWVILLIVLPYIGIFAYILT